MPHPRLIVKLEAAARVRRREFLLQQIVSLGEPPLMLDVGGTVDYWRSIDFPLGTVRGIVLLNTFDEQVNGPFEAVVGDGRDLSRFRDGEFDVVFSNSVIGHVGSFADQQRMAAEIRRVGKRFFVQTPNHDFPIDWRTLIPFFHFLPAQAQAWCFAHMRVGAYRRAENAQEAMDWATRIRNVRRDELTQLFPDGRVIDERLLGFTKSFMVHNFS